ncbi:YkgJ family cysteine cluster protein [bacterium]|nr:YkgJ family cysteine cluster protein [bacterium]
MSETPPRPWYASGLRFTCQQCGKCCRGPEPGYVWVSEDEIRALAKRLSMSVDSFGRAYLRRIGARFSLVERANHDCIFWKDGAGCTVYEQRPRQCRTFPFWEEFIETKEARESISWCKGKDSGRVYVAGEIQALARDEGETGA